MQLSRGAALGADRVSELALARRSTSTFEAARAPIVIGEPLGQTQPHGIGGGVARLDLDRLPRLQVVALDEAQERRDPDRRCG